jgi:hypothetical protein
MRSSTAHPVPGDPDQLMQALLDLAGNQRHAGAVFTIELRRLGAP